MVNGLRREDDDDDTEEVLSEKEGRKEGKMSGEQTEETDVPSEQMVFRVELRVFLGTHQRRRLQREPI